SVGVRHAQRRLAVALTAEVVVSHSNTDPYRRAPHVEAGALHSDVLACEQIVSDDLKVNVSVVQPDCLAALAHGGQTGASGLPLVFRAGAQRSKKKQRSRHEQPTLCHGSTSRYPITERSHLLNERTRKEFLAEPASGRTMLDS